MRFNYKVLHITGIDKTSCSGVVVSENRLAISLLLMELVAMFSGPSSISPSVRTKKCGNKGMKKQKRIIIVLFNFFKPGW